MASFNKSIIVFSDNPSLEPKIRVKMLLSSLIISLVCSMPAFAWKLPVGEFHFEKMTSQVYVIHGPLSDPNPEKLGFMNNPTFIEAANGIIVIDQGSSLEIGKQIHTENNSITSKPILAVFNNHIHGDHWLGNHAIQSAYPEVGIYAHRNTITQAKQSEGQIWLDLMDRLTAGASKGTELITAEISIADGDLGYIDGE